MLRSPPSFAVLGALAVAIGAPSLIRLAAADVDTSRRVPSRAPATEFLKGNTHTHSRHSGDASASLDEIARWYRTHDYDFVVITDHNRVTAPTERRGLLLIPGVELTRNPGRCDPPPPERRGRCRMHVNGLFVDPDRELDWERAGSRSRLAIYQNEIDTVDELGGVAQLNHPTWHHGVDGELLAQLASRGVAFVEIANDAFADWNDGDGEHPSTEQIWDEALSAGATVWGVASDDAHHFDPDRRDRDHALPPGGGFVMVRAEPDPDAIRDAMERGDFYSSTGLLLDRVDVSDDAVTIRVAEDSPGACEIVWIGDGGEVLQRDRGRSATFELDDAPEDATYVRAVATGADGDTAWIQPVRLD